jgi:hypothetical protein
MAKTEKELGRVYIENALDTLNEHFDLTQLYLDIHGKPAETKSEYYRFRNRFSKKRSNPGCDLLGLCVKNSPELRDMTMGEFFGVTKRPKRKP